MTTSNLLNCLNFYRKSDLAKLVTFQYHLCLDPLEDPMLVESFDTMMSEEFGEYAKEFNASDFFQLKAKS